MQNHEVQGKHSDRFIRLCSRTAQRSLTIVCALTLSATESGPNAADVRATGTSVSMEQASGIRLLLKAAPTAVQSQDRRRTIFGLLYVNTKRF